MLIDPPGVPIGMMIFFNDLCPHTLQAIRMTDHEGRGPSLCLKGVTDLCHFFWTYCDYFTYFAYCIVDRLN
jgi:hypothetical protein